MTKLPYVGGYEKRNSRSEAITLLEQFIQANDNDTGKAKLKDYQYSISSAKLADTTIHARQDIGHRLSDRNQNAKQLLRAISDKE